MGDEVKMLKNLESQDATLSLLAIGIFSVTKNPRKNRGPVQIQTSNLGFFRARWAAFLGDGRGFSLDRMGKVEAIETGHLMGDGWIEMMPLAILIDGDAFKNDVAFAARRA